MAYEARQIITDLIAASVLLGVLAASARKTLGKFKLLLRDLGKFLPPTSRQEKTVSQEKTRSANFRASWKERREFAAFALFVWLHIFWMLSANGPVSRNEVLIIAFDVALLFASIILEILTSLISRIVDSIIGMNKNTGIIIGVLDKNVQALGRVVDQVSPETKTITAAEPSSPGPERNERPQ